MKKLIIHFVLLCLLVVSGCLESNCCRETNNVICYRELTKETFLDLDISEVVSVEVVSEYGEEPHKWRRIYRNVFPILDKERIKIIHGCIRDGEPLDYYTDRYILFTTKDRIYYLGIGWIDETVYGNFWNAPELRPLFREWGVRRDAEEPPRETIVDSPRKRGRGMDQRE